MRIEESENEKSYYKQYHHIVYVKHFPPPITHRHKCGQLNSKQLRFRPHSYRTLGALHQQIQGGGKSSALPQPSGAVHVDTDLFALQLHGTAKIARHEDLHRQTHQIDAIEHKLVQVCERRRLLARKSDRI